jgi:hypothetical protein
VETEDSEEGEDGSELRLVEGSGDVCIGCADGKDDPFRHGESLGDGLGESSSVSVGPLEALEHEVSSDNDGASGSGSRNGEIMDVCSGMNMTGLEGAVTKGVSGGVGAG